MTDPEIDDEALAHIVEFYHIPELRQVTDYEKIVANKTVITVDEQTIYVFDAPKQKIYINSEDGHAITYGPQMVDGEHNQYLYKWDPNSTTYEYVNPYEWIKTKQPWQDWDDPEEE